MRFKCVKCGWIGTEDKFKATEKGIPYCKDELFCVDRIEKEMIGLIKPESHHGVP